MSGRKIFAEFERVSPFCLRMVVTEQERGVLDVAEVDPRRDGAADVLIAALDLVGPDYDLDIRAGFAWDRGRKTARASLVRAVVEGANNAG